MIIGLIILNPTTQIKTSTKVIPVVVVSLKETFCHVLRQHCEEVLMSPWLQINFGINIGES